MEARGGSSRSAGVGRGKDEVTGGWRGGVGGRTERRPRSARQFIAASLRSASPKVRSPALASRKVFNEGVLRIIRGLGVVD